MSKRELNPVESAGVGALSGIIEVVLQQPSVSVKNAIQDKKPISFNPRVLYRGLSVNAGSIAPVSAVQFGVNSFLEKSLSTPASTVQKGVIAGIAGMVSAFCSGPAELIMIQQQRTGLNLIKQIQTVNRKYGALCFFRGLPPTLVREGFFTAAYLDVNPLLQEKFQAAASFKDRQTLATVLAAVVSGSLSTFITHPFDTIKTRMQANLNLQKYRTVTSTAKVLLQEGGMAAFYSGLIPRTQRIICAVFILGEAKTHLTELYLKHFG
ncbi:hypothetical protein MPTK1_1g26850 [Marchantia polymorpha subsp. ruderalis]|uniref:Uncharacterized protein n=2 Tax=Marchantia polymorpha TaxID=3197 RepID=A0AAF6AUN5_MARPO|nr:hypothetical protein MARPO_0002s0193 [Marchantia polymorpha]BBN00156.1 hypothetical protein Mp_1g26850 [Marchantia polymorpha subsp. ruderalis]|eukprot:PTQ49729.1 hypothetical protein MARPO_0002s0193 [Marchantia polymorpha]